MDQQSATNDLTFIQQVMHRAQRRIDPHAFHFVSWGSIVLVWYPLANWFQNQGNTTAMIWLGVGALLLGFALSGIFEARLKARPRLPGEDASFGRQVCWIVYSSLAAGAFLSAFGPSFGFIEGPDVPIVWGLVYANMCFMLGVVYTREFLWSGAFIFGGVLLAIAFQSYNGYILGPFMGLGTIVPGVIAERRVARMRAEEGSEPVPVD